MEEHQTLEMLCSPHQSVGLHGAQRVVHLDVVTVVCALLQFQRPEGQADDRVGVRPQRPVAACVVGVRAVGEPRRGETGDFPFLGVEGKKAAICPGEQGRVSRTNEEGETSFPWVQGSRKRTADTLRF